MEYPTIATVTMLGDWKKGDIFIVIVNNKPTRITIIEQLGKEVYLIDQRAIVGFNLFLLRVSDRFDELRYRFRRWWYKILDKWDL